MENFRQVSLSNILRKIVEKYIRIHISQCIEKHLIPRPARPEFTKNRAILTNRFWMKSLEYSLRLS